MTTASTLDLMALAALVPVTALAVRREPRRDTVFWLLLTAAFLGGFLWSLSAHAIAWRSDLAAALWLSVAATWGVFALVSVLEKEAWRLVAIVSPVMLLMGILAVVWAARSPLPATAAPVAFTVSPGLGLHIAVTVATYAFVTIAAAAGFAGALQERALKAKRPTGLSRSLPALSVCDDIMIRLLAIAEGVLALGLISGMALNVQGSGNILSFDHKTVLVIGAFLLIGVVLLMHRLSGLRGRKAARWTLSAYLCLTLGYPGVKFVTDIVLN